MGHSNGEAEGEGEGEAEGEGEGEAEAEGEGEAEDEGEAEEDGDEVQDGMSVHSPSRDPLSSSSSLNKDPSDVELELRLLEALEIYPPVKLRGVHRHFVLYGLMEYLRRCFSRPFSPEDVLQLLDRFYNLEMLKPDDEETEILNQEEEFSLPESYFVKETVEPKGSV